MLRADVFGDAPSCGARRATVEGRRCRAEKLPRRGCATVCM